MARKHGRKKTAVVIATVLAAALLLAIGVGLAVILGRLREERSAALAGVQNYSAEIPRNPYGSDGFSSADGRISYADETWSSVAGIDVSVHQGTIDWQAVAGDGIGFAVIQAGYRGYTDGNLGEDEQFAANLSGAKAAGVPVGVYFFSQAVGEEEAREEARFVLSLLNGEALEYPIFYDWERVEGAEARTDAVTGETVTACAAAFCDEIQASGYEAGIYFNQNDVYTQIDLSRLLSYPLWMAQYQSQPDFFYDFAYWQYTDSGRVAGITGPVDLSIRFCKKAEA